MLSQAGGSVRCSHCKQRFNALESLHDDYPVRGTSRPRLSPRAGRPPLLGDPAALYAPSDTDGTQAYHPARSAPYRHRWAWITALVLLLALSVCNAAWTFRDSLARQPLIGEWLRGQEMPWADLFAPHSNLSSGPGPGGIHLVSRDIHEHPSRQGVLVLSATFVSLGDVPTPYPDLWMSLVDADNRVLAARDFRPDEYLPAGFDPDSRLHPGVHAPLLLEFVDPGEHAMGFELEFH